jgi:hypothetical protein
VNRELRSRSPNTSANFHAEGGSGSGRNGRAAIRELRALPLPGALPLFKAANNDFAAAELPPVYRPEIHVFQPNSG